MLSLGIEEPRWSALLSDTCSPKTLESNPKINTIPANTILELDCRLLPGQNPGEFIKTLETIISDNHMEITKPPGLSPAVRSTDTTLYQAIDSAVRFSF